MFVGEGTVGLEHVMYVWEGFVAYNVYYKLVYMSICNTYANNPDGHGHPSGSNTGWY